MLAKVSLDTTYLLTNWNNGNFDDSFRRFMIGLRDSINRGMNFIDAERINRSIIEKQL